MKIALCFSGQPRYVERCAPLILKHLIQDYEMDVFAHLWFDEQLTQTPFKIDDTGEWKNQIISKNAISIFRETYQPKAIKIEPSKSFSDPELFVDRARSEKMFWSNGSDDPMLAVREINNSLSYFYSLNAVLTLLKLHEYEHNFKYDWVIRCRTDCEIHEPIRLSEYDPDVLNCTSLRQRPPFINDWLNFGSSNVMEGFMGIFPIVRNIIRGTKDKYEGGWCIELVHAHMLDFLNIPISRHPIEMSLPRF